MLLLLIQTWIREFAPPFAQVIQETTGMRIKKHHTLVAKAIKRSNQPENANHIKTCTIFLILFFLTKKINYEDT